MGEVCKMTYTVNTGLLIQCGKTKILLDSILVLGDIASAVRHKLCGSKSNRERESSLRCSICYFLMIMQIIFLQK